MGVEFPDSGQQILQSRQSTWSPGQPNIRSQLLSNDRFTVRQSQTRSANIARIARIRGKNCNTQKNLRAYKNKIGIPPPPPKNPKHPPPPKTRTILWTQVFLQKERIFPGAHKIGARISGPRIADTNSTDTRIFLKYLTAEVNYFKAGRFRQSEQYFQKFRKGVGGQRGLARGNPSYARDSGLFSIPFFLCPLRRRGTHLWSLFFFLLGSFLGLLLVANPRAALKGTNLRGQTRFSAVFCGFLRKSAVFCENLRKSQMLRFLRKGENQRKSAKICVSARFVPLGSSPEARPETPSVRQPLFETSDISRF